jgi:histidinol-phosphatase (PHP family)
MKVDLHNHTYLCKHARGTMDEYVRQAVEAGIHIFGFSDHNPMHLDLKHRMTWDEVKNYRTMYQEVQEKYQDSIELLFGYEFDYLEHSMDVSLIQSDVDYLIGAVHLIENYHFSKFDAQGKDADSLWEDYFEQVKKMASSGHFQIAAHLDLIKILKDEKPKKDIRLIADAALKALKASGMSIEINASGLRKKVKETYPGRQLLEQAFEYDIPITFGSDSHAPEHVGYKREHCEELLKEIGYNSCVYYVKKEPVSVKFA